MIVTFDTDTAVLWVMRASVVIILIALIGYVRFLVIRVIQFFRWKDNDILSRKEMRKRWTHIEELLREGKHSEAVVESDKLLDDVLKAKAMPGATFAERLSYAQRKYPFIRRMWWAHKLRNRLVHEFGFHPDKRTAKGAVAAYRRALEEFGAL